MHSPQLTVEQKESLLIESNMLEGVVSRAGTLFFTWSFIGVLYGFLSYDLFRQKLPELTLWGNVWPRILYSSFPVFCIALFYKDSRNLTKLKAYLTVLLLPVSLMSASLIHAWPLFWKGEYDFYLQFHASNIIAMASGIFVISASPRMVFAQSVGFIVLFFGPLLNLFYHEQPYLSQIIFSDALMVTIILIVTQNSVHKLRLTLAVEDHRRRKKASLFLGKTLTDAIYENQKIIPDDGTREGLIMSVDLRGYTKFFQSTDPTIVRAFMAEYYSVVTKTLSTKPAFLHKTIGDGLLISFGVMDKDIDLSDFPEAAQGEIEAQKRKRSECLRMATQVFFEIAKGIEDLSQKHNVPLPMKLGAGCAYGPIELLVRGDETYRQEMDIQGSTIIKSVRIEAYSKLLNSQIDSDSSFLLVAPELMDAVSAEQGFKTLLITKPEQQVRDFPDIQMLLYRQWKHRVASTSGLRAA